MEMKKGDLHEDKKPTAAVDPTPEPPVPTQEDENVLGAVRSNNAFRLRHGKNTEVVAGYEREERRERLESPIRPRGQSPRQESPSLRTSRTRRRPPRDEEDDDEIYGIFGGVQSQRQRGRSGSSSRPRERSESPVRFRASGMGRDESECSRGTTPPRARTTRDASPIRARTGSGSAWDRHESPGRMRMATQGASSTGPVNPPRWAALPHGGEVPGGKAQEHGPVAQTQPAAKLSEAPAVRASAVGQALSVAQKATKAPAAPPAATPAGQKQSTSVTEAHVTKLK